MKIVSLVQAKATAERRGDVAARGQGVGSTGGRRATTAAWSYQLSSGGAVILRGIHDVGRDRIDMGPRAEDVSVEVLVIG